MNTLVFQVLAKFLYGDLQSSFCSPEKRGCSLILLLQPSFDRVDQHPDRKQGLQSIIVELVADPGVFSGLRQKFRLEVAGLFLFQPSAEKVQQDKGERWSYRAVE